jgi:hypothetical protein
MPWTLSPCHHPTAGDSWDMISLLRKPNSDTFGVEVISTLLDKAGVRTATSWIETNRQSFSPHPEPDA